jgi:hypothetical protein
MDVLSLICKGSIPGRDMKLSPMKLAEAALPTTFSSQSYMQSVGLLGRGISPSQGRYSHDSLVK